MDLTELRKVLYVITKQYFSDAEVRWGEQNSEASHDDPFVRLKLENVRREQFPHEAVELGSVKRYIPSEVWFSVELFTHGQKVTVENGQSFYINTATNDIEAFVDYIDSHYVNWMCLENNIAIMLDGDVIETTAVKDADYEYRAMQRFRVMFTHVSRGVTGTDRVTVSGGGNAELFGYNDISFDEIDIREELK